MATDCMQITREVVRLAKAALITDIRKEQYQWKQFYRVLAYISLLERSNPRSILMVPELQCCRSTPIKYHLVVKYFGKVSTNLETIHAGNADMHLVASFSWW